MIYSDPRTKFPIRTGIKPGKKNFLKLRSLDPRRFNEAIKRTFNIVQRALGYNDKAHGHDLVDLRGTTTEGLNLKCLSMRECQVDHRRSCIATKNDETHYKKL